MRHLLLGVIGHVDHGKTALVRALTGMETDRLPEEQRRGISIALGFAHVRIGDDEIDIIDMPGHERFVRTMVSGATGIDAVLLVVAANEGVMPQTVEHVDIAVLLGLRRAVIVITKSDLVPPEAAATMAAEVAAFATRSGLRSDAPILASAVTGAGLDAIRHAIGEIILDTTPPTDAGYAYLPVDRAFTIAGHGTVVTGTLRRGRMTTGTELEITPGGQRTRIRSLQVHGATVPTAEPGQRVAVNLRGMELASVPRGVALCDPGLLPPSDWLSVALTAVADAVPLHTTSRFQLLFGTDEVEARLRLLDRDTLAAGQTALAQLHCTRPISVPSREHFILRLASPAVTVAGGRILDPAAHRLRRHAPRTLARLAALARADGDQILQGEINASAGEGVALHRLARLAGIAPARVIQRLPGLDVERTRSDMIIARTSFEKILSGLPRLLQTHAAGLSRERLALIAKEVGAPVLDEAIARLITAGTLRQDGGLIRVPRPAQEREQASQESQLADRLAEAIRKGALTPPDMPPDIPTRRMLDRLIRAGVLVRTFDKVQKREVLFHHEAIEAARRQLTPLMSQGGGLLVREAGAALGISRKFSVPLLEYLDQIQFTRRVGDRRMLTASAQT